MVIGMGVSVLIARRGQANAPFILTNMSSSPLENLSNNPYIPLSSQVNKCNGIPVKRAEK
jgi:hypothetical protein